VADKVAVSAPPLPFLGSFKLRYGLKEWLQQICAAALRKNIDC
jgi:hypothetical protein